MSERALDRESLRSLFDTGTRPNANNFGSLIDSMVNKVDDRISKNLENGLMLAPEGKESGRVVSFFDDIQGESPRWTFEMPLEGAQGLSISEPVSETQSETRIFFQKGGNIGIGTKEPKTSLEVDGILGTSARMGTYMTGAVPADGQWHDIITNLNGCTAFEIMAQVGKEKEGKYALLHATALSTFGRSRSKIRCTQAHYGWWWNKLALKWHGSTYDYGLRLRTRSNYGSGLEIKYCVTRLWDNDISAHNLNTV